MRDEIDDDGSEMMMPLNHEVERMKKYLIKPALTHLSSEAVDSLLVNKQFKKAMQIIFRKNNNKNTSDTNVNFGR